MWPIAEKDTHILWRAFDDVSDWVVSRELESLYTTAHDAYISNLSPQLFDKVRKEVEHIESLRTTSTSNQETSQ
jgi:hypothetical protein